MKQESDRRGFRLRSPEKRELQRTSRWFKSLARVFPVIENERARLVARDILRDALDDQMSLMAKGRFDKFKEKKDSNFLKVFLADQLFLDLYAQAQEIAPTFLGNDIDFKKRLRGALFERMSYAYLSGSDTDGIPLMGENVVEISKVLNPNRQVHDYGFGEVGIDGVYVPDGYMVNPLCKEPRITGIVECKLGFRQVGIAEQKRLLGRELKKLGTIVDLNTYFTVVSPDFGVSMLSCDGVENITLPVSLNIFMDDFFPFIYAQYRDGNSSTLAELSRYSGKSPS